MGAPASRVAPRVIVLKPGPTYNLSDLIEFQAQALSRRLSGEYWTWGPVRMDREIGKFRIDCVTGVGFDTFTRLIYLFRRVVQGVGAVRRAGGAVVFVSYDPFLDGLIALAIRALTGARFICEVNGVHGNRDNLAHLGTGWRAAFKYQVMKAVARFVIDRADGVRLLYREQLEGVTDDVPSERIRCSFDAVPLDRFVDLGSERMVLFAGYPFMVKGVDVLLSAFEGLQDEFPDWELVIIGHEMPEEVARRRPRIRRLSVLRGMPNVEIAPWIGRAGILVLPSRSEGMGRVLIEAAAAGKPRIASRVGGTYTVVRDGIDGLLVPPKDVGALREALRRLMASETLRVAYGEAARRMVRESFSPDAYCAAVSGFVEDVYRRGRSEPA